MAHGPFYTVVWLFWSAPTDPYRLIEAITPEAQGGRERGSRISRLGTGQAFSGARNALTEARVDLSLEILGSQGEDRLPLMLVPLVATAKIKLSACHLFDPCAIGLKNCQR